MKPGTRKIWLLSIVPVAVLAGLFLYWAAVGNVSKNRAEIRSLRAKQAGTNDAIQVAAVWPIVDTNQSFVQGLTLARDEINKIGGVLGRQIRLVFYREEPMVARRLAKDPNTVAVIGYRSSEAALRDNVTLNNEGILFITPYANHPYVTLKDFDYTFRTTPSEVKIAEWLTEHALVSAAFYRGPTNSEVRVLVLQARTFYGYELSRYFYRDAANWRLVRTSNGETNTTTMRVVQSIGYDPDTTDFLPLVDKALDQNDKKFDAVLVADDELPRAAYLIRQLRVMGINKIVMGGHGLDSPTLFTTASNKAFEVYFPSKFVQPSRAMLATLPTNLLVHTFLRRFHQVYGAQPDFEAAQSYEALCLLAEAYLRAGTTSPPAISSTLEHTGNWVGLLEVYPKFENHDLVISKNFIKYLASTDYPTTDVRQNQIYIIRDLLADPYTNHWYFAGYLSSVSTNQFINIDRMMHVPPHYPTGVY